MEEQWKNLGFLGYHDYEVSNLGRVRSLKNGQGARKKKMVDGFFVMKPHKAKIGYPVVVLVKTEQGTTNTFIVLWPRRFYRTQINSH